MRQYGQVLAASGHADRRVGERHDGTGSGVAALMFRGGPLLCALRLDEVIETMRPLTTQPLAGMPAFVRGISVLRGISTPVIDVARLLAGVDAKPARFVAVRTDRGPVALATGEIIGTWMTEIEEGDGNAGMLSGTAAERFVAGIGTFGAEPLLLLRSLRAVPDEVWELAGLTTTADKSGDKKGESESAP